MTQKDKMLMTQTIPITLGAATVKLEVTDGLLTSIGAVTVHGTALRSADTRFLPWFDTYEGDIFRAFRLGAVEQRGATTVVHTTALSDPDTLFRERRDSSGDLCFRATSWDSPVREARFDLCFAPAQASIDGRAFAGFRYWFEYEGELPIHRLVDRQTWELGGNLDDVTVCLRNWLPPPRMRLRKETTYSTVGLDKWASLLPGNLWARWSLLPGFDLQYGAGGVTAAWFDEVSLIRTVVESNAGEDCIRCLDMHLFAQANKVATNPKTVLHCPDQLDATDALNLWTRLQDREQERAQAQFGIPAEAPPGIVFGHNVWRNIHFDRTYEDVVQVASEFHADYVFIDVVFEHEQAYAEYRRTLVTEEQRANSILAKVWDQNMCCILDWKVNEIWGGEAGLKRLCDRAAAKGVKILSWMSTHASQNSYLNDQANPEARRLGGGANGVFAAKESGRHPDTGYAASCWTFNLNTPITGWMRDRLIGTCERTGLAGFLWDSFSNMGWWQIDYSQGTMAPQFAAMAGLYADLAKAGLYLQPESLATLSSHGCCGLHGGNIYADDLLGYSYNTSIGLWFGGGDDHGETTLECQILKGQAPFDVLFQCVAHKRLPGLHFHMVPREQWHPERLRQIKELLAIYREQRHRMVRRTVLKDGLGVRWDGGDRPLLFAFRAGPAPVGACDAASGEAVTTLSPNHAYLC